MPVNPRVYQHIPPCCLINVGKRYKYQRPSVSHWERGWSCHIPSLYHYVKPCILSVGQLLLSHMHIVHPHHPVCDMHKRTILSREEPAVSRSCAYMIVRKFWGYPVNTSIGPIRECQFSYQELSTLILVTSVYIMACRYNRGNMGRINKTTDNSGHQHTVPHSIQLIHFFTSKHSFFWDFLIITAIPALRDSVVSSYWPTHLTNRISHIWWRVWRSKYVKESSMSSQDSKI